MLTTNREAADAPLLDRGSEGPASFRSLFDAVLDELDHGVMICGPCRRIVGMNACAQAELAAGTAMTMRDGRLHLPDEQDHEALQRAFRQVAAGRRGLVAVGPAEARIYLSVVPLANLPPDHGVLLLLGRRQPFGQLAMEMFSSLYGLTHCERRVLMALLEGQRPADMAIQFSVALSTVRTQVASIREKLGVRRVEDLFQIAAALPPISSVLRRLMR